MKRDGILGFRYQLFTEDYDKKWNSNQNHITFSSSQVTAQAKLANVFDTCPIHS